MRSIELFAGAGGLGMGMSRAGFHHELVLEWDQDACDTIRKNQGRGVEPVSDWPLVQDDVRHINFRPFENQVDVISGGPPCQPFSLGGKHKGHQDNRNMFPEVFRAVREVKPKAVLIENVKGLLRESFSSYFEYITLQLTHPEVLRTDDEGWHDHLRRLEQHHTSCRHEDGLTYRVAFRLLNAANFGVPQRRERVFIIGIRSDVNAHWSFPEETHSQDALLHQQFVTGDYWERHQVPVANRPNYPTRSASRLERLGNANPELLLEPWLTVRDAICDLPVPQPGFRHELESDRFFNHVLMPGARPYHGHTGSPFDEPAKTLKAGDHGVPGGENMVANLDGSHRYFTVREAARLQSFPDLYRFSGSWSETMRQLGNAVPVRLAEVVASSVKNHLLGAAISHLHAS